MDNPEKLATQGTQDEEKQKKNTLFVGHHYMQNVSKYILYFFVFIEIIQHENFK